jgi:hypothetical protein
LLNKILDVDLPYSEESEDLENFRKITLCLKDKKVEVSTGYFRDMMMEIQDQ